MDGARRRALRCSTCGAERQCPFNSLDPEARAAFEAMLETRVYSRGAVILRQGDAARALYILRSGRVRTTHLTSTGKPVGGRLLAPPALLGLTEVVTGDRYLLGAEAAAPCTLEYLSRGAFAPFLLHHPQVALGLLIQVSQELARLQARLFDAAGGECLSERLLTQLQELAGSFGVPTEHGTLLDLPVTVRELAGALGCSRQWASKLLGEIESQGLIERDGRRILLTPAGLGESAEAAP